MGSRSENMDRMDWALLILEKYGQNGGALLILSVARQTRL